MIEFVQVQKRYGAQVLLEGESFRLVTGERAGFVGPNGAGKSTLFDLITGEAEADGGRIERMKGLRIGYLRQHLTPGTDKMGVREFVEKAAPDLEEIKREIADLEGRLGSGGGEEAAMVRRLGELQTQFEDRGGYGASARASAALAGLGFRAEDLGRPLEEFSGGWRMRAELARAMMAEPDLLLLDEPSNYLDIPAVEWLRRRLEDFRGTLAMISHDRYLLEALCTVTFEVAGGRVTRYPGRYSWYAREREKRRAQAAARAANEERRREQIERFVERFRSKNTLATRVQSKIKMLEKMERTEVREVARGTGAIRLAPPTRCGELVLRCEGVGFRYGAGEPWIFRGVDWELHRGEKVAVVGPNGAGKTTLLRVMAGELKPDEGRCGLGHLVEAGYQSQETAGGMPEDHDCLAVVKAAAPDASEGELRTLLGGFGFSGKAVEKRVGVLSGGERIRLAFARILARPPNLLLLDEPTTHLDVESREALQDALCAYAGTVVMVSHDVEFVRAVAGEILEVKPGGGGVRAFGGGYDFYREVVAREGGEKSTPRRGNAEEALKGENDGEKSAAERWEERKARKAELRKAERELARVEGEIARLEEAQGAAMEAAGAADATPEERAAAGRRLKELATELEARYAEWEAVGARRDELAGDDS
jgi:ATP-binding cassette subfamily F protein 3